jgi:hypothetical protein
MPHLPFNQSVVTMAESVDNITLEQEEGKFLLFPKRQAVHSTWGWQKLAVLKGFHPTISK